MAADGEGWRREAKRFSDEAHKVLAVGKKGLGWRDIHTGPYQAEPLHCFLPTGALQIVTGMDMHAQVCRHAHVPLGGYTFSLTASPCEQNSGSHDPLVRGSLFGGFVGTCSGLGMIGVQGRSLVQCGKNGGLRQVTHDHRTAGLRETCVHCCFPSEIPQVFSVPRAMELRTRNVWHSSESLGGEDTPSHSLQSCGGPSSHDPIPPSFCKHALSLGPTRLLHPYLSPSASSTLELPVNPTALCPHGFCSSAPQPFPVGETPFSPSPPGLYRSPGTRQALSCLWLSQVTPLTPIVCADDPLNGLLPGDAHNYNLQ